MVISTGINQNLKLVPPGARAAFFGVRRQRGFKQVVTGELLETGPRMNPAGLTDSPQWGITFLPYRICRKRSAISSRLAGCGLPKVDIYTRVLTLNILAPRPPAGPGRFQYPVLFSHA